MTQTARSLVHEAGLLEHSRTDGDGNQVITIMDRRLVVGDVIDDNGGLWGWTWSEWELGHGPDQLMYGDAVPPELRVGEWELIKGDGASAEDIARLRGVLGSYAAMPEDDDEAERIEAPRYTVISGSYSGGSDDVAGRWYIVDRLGDVIDKRGRGYATREDALEAIVDRLSMHPDPADLVGAQELAERAGVAVSTVHSWRARQRTFPEPVVRLSTGSVWDWREVAAWLPSLRTTRPRRA